MFPVWFCHVMPGVCGRGCGCTFVVGGARGGGHGRSCTCRQPALHARLAAAPRPRQRRIAHLAECVPDALALAAHVPGALDLRWSEEDNGQRHLAARSQLIAAQLGWCGSCAATKDLWMAATHSQCRGQCRARAHLVGRCGCAPVHVGAHGIRAGGRRGRQGKRRVEDLHAYGVAAVTQEARI